MADESTTATAAAPIVVNDALRAKKRFTPEEVAAIKAIDDPNCGHCGEPKHDHGFDVKLGGGYGEYLGDKDIDCKAFQKV